MGVNTDWGDAQTMDDDRPLYAADEPCWMFHDLHVGGNPRYHGHKISSYVKALCPDTGLASLRHVWVDELPEGASAAGCVKKMVLLRNLISGFGSKSAG